MNKKYFKVVEVDGVWYALRELTQRDLSIVHLNPQPRDIAKRIQFRGKLYAGDRLTKPLFREEAKQLHLTSREFDAINRSIASQNLGDSSQNVSHMREGILRMRRGVLGPF